MLNLALVGSLPFLVSALAAVVRSLAALGTPLALLVRAPTVAI
ncbi:hypothetical protein [Hydrocarboniphaga effusa]